MLLEEHQGVGLLDPPVPRVENQGPETRSRGDGGDTGSRQWQLQGQQWDRHPLSHLSIGA